MHTTSAKLGGKISKRKTDKSNAKLNLGSIQCFNLNEKEKFRQLIAQNCLPTTKFNNKNNANPNKNLYKQFIHSSPTKVKDDNTYETKVKNDLNLPAFIPSSLPANSASSTSNNNNTKVSSGYSRRISLSLEPFDLSVNSKSTNSVLKNNNLIFNSTNNNSSNLTHKQIIEIDITSSSTPSNLNRLKSAQKRPSTQNDENGTSSTTSSIENLKKETRDYYSLADHSLMSSSNQNGFRSTNRQLTSLEKSIQERLNKNQSILEQISNRSNQKLSTMMLEEERYKLKKRQRLERDKIEKELALKFSQQLYLDSNKITSIYLQEEKKEIEEDEFAELNEEQELLVNNALINSPQDEVLANAFNISITRKDIQTLRGLNWLNDEIINFYMSLIAERSKQAEIKIHTFTTFFYPKLLKDGYQSLKRWTRKTDIFSFDLILIPIHLGLHWTLSIIDFTCKEIRYYDSMNGNNNECLKALKNYLKEEYADKKGNAQLDLSDWNCIHVKDVPQQMNGSDCGMFTCKYAEFASRGKTVFSFNQSHMPYFRRRMIWEIINKKLM